MSTIVEATVPADQFALSDTFFRVPAVEFRVVRLVAHGFEDVLPFLWADCDDPGRLRSVLERDRTVRSVDILTTDGEECLIRLEWDSRVRALVSILEDEDASILDASGYDDTWHFQIFFPDHDVVARTYQCCKDQGIDISIDRLSRLSEAAEYGSLGLTEPQYETLLSAYELGYYDVPRAVNQAELATHFDVSHQALSERLRRAHQTVITNALYHKIHRRDHAVSPRMRHEADT